MNSQSIRSLLVITLLVGSFPVFASLGRKVERACAPDPEKFLVHAYDNEMAKYQLGFDKENEISGFSGNHLESTAFRMLHRKSQRTSQVACMNVRANTAFYYLNKIHSYFQKMLPHSPRLFDHLSFPIDVRINVDDRWTEDGLFSGGRWENDAATICGWNDVQEVHSPHLNRIIYERTEINKPEIWFYRPRVVQRNITAWHPMCWLGFMEKSPICNKVRSADFAFVPEAVYHEYVHLLTDPHIESCVATVVGEAYSNYFAIRLSPAGAFGRGLGQKIYPHVKMKFGSLVPYKKEIHEDVTPQAVKFYTNLMGELLRRLEEYFTTEEIDLFVIHSATLIKTLAEGSPKLKHLLPAIQQSCNEQLSQQDSKLPLCLETIQQLQNEVFGVTP